MVGAGAQGPEAAVFLSSARPSVGRCPAAWPTGMCAVLPKRQASLGLSQDKVECRKGGNKGKHLAPHNFHT